MSDVAVLFSIYRRCPKLSKLRSSELQVVTIEVTSNTCNFYSIIAFFNTTIDTVRKSAVV